MNRFRACAWLCAMAVHVLLAKTVSADMWLDDGSTHTVDYPIGAGQGIRCADGPGGPTTLEYTEGASVTESVVYVFGTSQAHVTGGRIEWVLATYDESHADVRGGDINTVDAKDGSSIDISGGWIRWYLSAAGHGEVTMTGGILDGSVEVHQDGIVTLMGGTIVDHGDSDYLWVSDNGKIYVHGVFNHEAGPLRDTSGQLTGTLHGGSLLDIEFKRFHETAEIIVVAEQSTVSSPAPACGVGMSALVPLGAAATWLSQRRLSRGNGQSS